MRKQGHTTRRELGAITAASVMGLRTRSALAQAPVPPDPWPVIAEQIFGDRHIGDGIKVLALDAPDRALDAAVVPISVRALPQNDRAAGVRGITLVIDQNPSPLAAKFVLGTGSGVDVISTRVRVDDYTNIHAIAELDGETDVAVKKFIKAAGGCSAPTVKEEATDIALGTMRFRQFPPKPNSNAQEAQLIIRHPNNSGMQMDQVTRLYVPAHYITSVKIFQGDSILLIAETGISMSQNPELRFSFKRNGAKFFRAEATDNKNGRFFGHWPAAAT